MKYPIFETQALCHEIDPDMFFEADDRSSYTQLALVKTVCNRCPSKQPCLEYALHNAVHGVWAGTTHRERKEIQKQRGIVPIPLILGGER